MSDSPCKIATSPPPLAGRPLPPRVGSAIVVSTLLMGCVSDTTLLDENASVALRSARFQARSDLGCPQVTVTVLSEKEVPGAPWGYLYSDYRVAAEGCGRRVNYDVECRDERLCDVSRSVP